MVIVNFVVIYKHKPKSFQQCSGPEESEVIFKVTVLPVANFQGYTSRRVRKEFSKQT